MQKNSSFGPRGWAVLTLVGGVTFAAPFLRQPRLAEKQFANASSLPPTSGPNPTEAMRPTTNSSASSGSAFQDSVLADGLGFSERIVPPAATTPTALPAWAPTRSPLDQLISQGTAPPWNSDARNTSTIKPLEPWVNAAESSQPPLALPPTLARAWPDANSLPITDSAPVAARTPGSLAATAQHVYPSSTPRLRQPANPAPTQPQYVYQPGFHGSSPPTTRAQ